MKNLNKEDQSNFEKSWKEAFEGAEIDPSEDVWLKIDNVLANQETKGLKKSVVFYRYAAIASFLLLCTAVISIYINNGNWSASQDLAEGETVLNEGVQGPSNQTQSPQKNNELEVESIGKEPSNNKYENEQVENDKQFLSKKENNGPAIEKLIQGQSTDKLNGSSESSNIKNSETASSLNSIALNDQTKATQEGNSIEGSKSSGGTTYPGNKRLNNSKSDQEKVLPEKKNNIAMQDLQVNKPDQSSTVGSVPDDENKAFNEDFAGEAGFVGHSNFANLGLLAGKDFITFEIPQAQLQQEIYRVPEVSKGKIPEKSAESKAYYAGVQFSPGYFDPNIQMNPGTSVVSANRTAYSQMGVNPSNQQQNLQPEMSYTYGMNFGVKMSKRWLLNVGLQYAQHQTTGVTRQFFQDDNNMRFLATPTTLSMANDALSEVGFSNAPITMNTTVGLNNNFEFASIPVKAGFLIVDKKISWIVSTGVATDFFLKSEVKIQDQNQFGEIESSKIRPGEASDYRNFYFNGLASSEIIFHLSKNYSISLEPTFRTALNSFTKSDRIISSRPQSFGVAAGFKFNF
nr:hypothetical protein [Bacteroidota bacterium]